MLHDRLLIPRPLPSTVDGHLQRFSAEKLQQFLQTLSWDLDTDVLDIPGLVAAISTSIAPHISADDLQLHSAATIAATSTIHPHFSRLGGRIFVALLHKKINKTFSSWVQMHGDGPKALLSAEFVHIVRHFGTDLDDAIVHSRDFTFTYPAIRTMAHNYLLRDHDGQIVERPQYMYMRAAVAAHGNSIDLVLRTYDALSRHLFTPASPVLFNAGTNSSHYASCFLYQPDPTTTSSQLQSARDLDAFWLADGGIGLSLADIPARRSLPIQQPGILPLLKVYDAHAAYASLCHRKRPAAATVHLPIWHADVRSFIQARTTQAQRARVWHIYPSVWIPDIFMDRLRDQQMWSLFDPRDVPMLLSSYGEDFTRAYKQYEHTVEPIDRVACADIWILICRAQQETGTPFIMYSDAINRKNNHAHLGILQTSNLCTEILQSSSTKEPAVCTLASIAIPRFVRLDRSYDFDALHALTRLVVLTADALLDRNDYPTDGARRSAMNTRPIGIGVQGLADVFLASGLPFQSTEARQLNKDIFETIYHAAYQTSCDLAEQLGPYPLYPKSPAARGILQPDMWEDVVLSGRHDFDTLRSRISLHGIRHSMLTAQMPTASTAKLLGNFDSTEPYTSNVVTHRVISGDYTEICPWLVSKLTRRNLWTEDIRTSILQHHGSIQRIAGIPADVKDVFLTAWEIDPMTIIDMAADRGPFIDQTQSMSLHVTSPTPDSLLILQMHAWTRGLKTGLYYLRTQAPTYPRAFGVGAPPVNEDVAPLVVQSTDAVVPSRSPHCESCSS
ncbi:putative ribonucleoside-diphosphate reductase large chain [Lentinus brumalis]|uniref:Ribonucleoside-diphosphate reductase n=1 Tax=Lentinus brumalis TaxID=2498619 RepID=A0A371DFM9_9APHY|nr:putative ribonucleoside-diphosphate reductase large chain [Polyporus brumalis]